MATEKDYLMSVDMFNNPTVIEGTRAKAMKIIRLILMEPGSDPLHPNMGVGLRQYRFALNSGIVGSRGIDILAQRTEEQVKTYLPHLQTASIDFTITTDHKLSIEITMNDESYVYEPDDDPIYIDDLL